MIKHLSIEELIVQVISLCLNAFSIRLPDFVTMLKTFVIRFAWNIYMSIKKGMVFLF